MTSATVGAGALGTTALSVWLSGLESFQNVSKRSRCWYLYYLFVYAHNVILSRDNAIRQQTFNALSPAICWQVPSSATTLERHYTAAKGLLLLTTAIADAVTQQQRPFSWKY